jgi:dihydrofolate reductase
MNSNHGRIGMTRISVVENISLDGVMQAPGGAEEDTRGGFVHGGWAWSYRDEVQDRVMGADMAKEGGLLFGRRTYEKMMRAWAGRDDNPFTPVLERRRKYVASRTLREPLPWVNSTLLTGDAATAVRDLKAGAPEGELVVLGSGELVRALFAAGLVDELKLLIHPLVLGTGMRLFPEGGARAPLTLTDSVTTTTGVVIATYRAAA